MNSKEFNDKLRLENFEELESKYQQTKLYFEQLNDNITCEEVKKKFPAFCFDEKVLCIMFPTFKIRIINEKINENYCYKLLSNIGNYEIYEESNIVSLPKFIPIQTLTIHCLEDNLDKNIETAEKIEDKLASKHFCYERHVAYGLYSLPIKVDEAGYILVNSKNIE